MITSIELLHDEIIETFKVQPNPFSHQFQFRYTLTESVDAYLRIYNGTGQLLINNDIGRQHLGKQEVTCLPDVPLVAGPYFYQLILINRDGQEILKSGVIIKKEE